MWTPTGTLLHDPRRLLSLPLSCWWLLDVALLSQLWPRLVLVAGRASLQMMALRSELLNICSAVAACNCSHQVPHRCRTVWHVPRTDAVRRVPCQQLPWCAHWWAIVEVSEVSQWAQGSGLDCCHNGNGSWVWKRLDRGGRTASGNVMMRMRNQLAGVIQYGRFWYLGHGHISALVVTFLCPSISLFSRMKLLERVHVKTGNRHRTWRWKRGILASRFVTNFSKQSGLRSQ